MLARELIKQLEEAGDSYEVWLASSGHDCEPIESAIRAVGDSRIMLYGEPPLARKETRT